MENITGIRLKLISDTEKHQSIESMIKDVISMIPKGYEKLIKNNNYRIPKNLHHISYTYTLVIYMETV